ncbi:inorganic polyphosphate/ATP-NAD kinase [Vibrio angustum S14]|uniref:Inorganic polyphosphate/ATP-NAD kinase n=1 Tax=Photobacterium angustum (strain S14 / CCUG 15956) TaxID=314292 RepID=Q1ZJZ8_PHOAS|nr:inorganic polyphosphate/ATP-NAD kinase [Vibrio angustum S14] [Photobacterium angustum S14]
MIQPNIDNKQRQVIFSKAILPSLLDVGTKR